MSIVKAVLAARQEIPAITADETATISGTKGSFKFKYASLQGLLEVVVPLLVKHGVLLVQRVTSEYDGILKVNTTLTHEDNSFIESGPMHIKTDGSTRDIASKATSLKRIQLVAMLGLVVDDDDQPVTNTYQQRPQQTQPTTQRGGEWEAQTPHRTAVMRGNKNDGSAELETLKMRLRQADKLENNPMPTAPAEGKKVSMYGYLMDLASKALPDGADPTLALSFLYGRVISTQTPPNVGTKFLIDELSAGRHNQALAEAYKKAAT